MHMSEFTAGSITLGFINSIPKIVFHARAKYINNTLAHNQIMGAAFFVTFFVGGIVILMAPQYVERCIKIYGIALVYVVTIVYAAIIVSNETLNVLEVIFCFVIFVLYVLLVLSRSRWQMLRYVGTENSKRRETMTMTRSRSIILMPEEERGQMAGQAKQAARNKAEADKKPMKKRRDSAESGYSAAASEYSAQSAHSAVDPPPPAPEEPAAVKSWLSDFAEASADELPTMPPQLGPETKPAQPPPKNKAGCCGGMFSDLKQYMRLFLQREYLIRRRPLCKCCMFIYEVSRGAWRVYGST